MAHLFGLIRFFVAGVLGASWCLVVAAYPATSGTQTVYRTGGQAATDSSTAGASCTLFRTLYRSSYTHNVIYNGSCYMGYSNLNPPGTFMESVSITTSSQTVYSCPGGGTLSGTSCTCPSGYQDNAAGTACEPIPTVNLCSYLLGKSAGTYNGPGGLGAKQLCITEVSSGDPALPGCRATGEATFGYESTNVGSLGVMYWSAVMAFDGSKCAPNANGSTDASGSTPPAPPAPGPTTSEETQCPVGKVPGEVNGQTICVTPGTDTPQQAKKETNETEQKADGTTVEKTTSKQTVCDATKCTTTTTTTTKTTPPGGTASTTTETSTSTCVVGSPDCSAKAGVGGGGGGASGDGTDPSSFGGSCSQAFSCKGDAIMCAVSLEQHKRNCALFVDSSPESILYGNEKGKTGAQYTSENVTISSGSFNSSNAFGGAAQCIQDKTLTVWGTQVVLPFSNVCGTLAHLGTLLMTLSFLLAFRIVARG